MKKQFLAVLKTFGLALIMATFVFVAREVFSLGSEEYFSSVASYKFLQTYAVCLASLILGWIYVYVFRCLNMI